MPDEGFKIENLRYGTTNGVVLKPISEVGELVSLSVDDDGILSRSYYHEMTADLSGRIVLKIPWWQRNRVARMLGYRAFYRIASLKRGGKSHHGKEM